MGINFFKTSYTNCQRSVSDFNEITKSKPEKALSFLFIEQKVVITVVLLLVAIVGTKRLYRDIDFRRDKIGMAAKVIGIEYDPNRNARIALLRYEDGENVILSIHVILTLEKLLFHLNAPILVGNSLPLRIFLGAEIHNVEFQPGSGGQLARSAGTLVEILAKEGNFVTVRLPSKEIRLVSKIVGLQLVK
jgi:large subunit ribosomal protein L2